MLVEFFDCLSSASTRNLSWRAPVFAHYRTRGGLPAENTPGDISGRGYALLTPRRPWRYHALSEEYPASLFRSGHLINGDDLRYHADADGSTYCNVFVADVAASVGAPLPRVLSYGGPLFEADAVAMWAWVVGPGRKLGWVEIGLPRAVTCAARRFVIMYNPPEASRHGHVAVVMPGSTLSRLRLLEAARQGVADVKPRVGARFACFAGPLMTGATPDSSAARLLMRADYVLWAVAELLARSTPPHGFETWPVVAACLYAEDRRFWSHMGVEPRAIARALIRTVRGNPQGGSTLVQQLVRRVLGWYEVTPERKISELAIALLLGMRVERRLLLWAYLLTAYFGYNAFGIYNASALLFGEPFPERLSGETAAMLAAALKYPLRRYRDECVYARRRQRALWILRGV